MRRKYLPKKRLDELGALWLRKLHPCGKENDGRTSDREKDRRYARFAGRVEPGGIGEAEAVEIARLRQQNAGSVNILEFADRHYNC